MKRLFRRLLRGVGLAAASALVLSLATAAGDPHPLATAPAGPPDATAPTERVGALHVHTRASDGGGTLDDVAEAALDAGLDFVAVTDHHARPLTTPARRAGVLLVVGEELRVPDGHVVVLGGAATGAPELRIAAHPEGPTRPWRGAGRAGFDALEVWNWDSDWRDDGLRDWAGALALLMWKPEAAMLRLIDRPAASLERWDALLTEGEPVPGLCAVDAHQRVTLGAAGALPFPRYRDLFRLARMHVWLDDDAPRAPVDEAAAVVEALRRGRAFCAFDARADSRGTRVWAAGPGGTAGPGQTLVWSDPPPTLSVRVPDPGKPVEIVVVRAGEGPVHRVPGPEALALPLPGPGVYRVEVSLLRGRRAVPWILTNPLRIVEAGPEG
ncbi:MAG: hypothetical protein D6701_00850 [Gemmatimonadetes bacterium]|nr:MAG: hypothetical protein D6701_00850 [Gemmatimonadota bacterium]